MNDKTLLKRLTTNIVAILPILWILLSLPIVQSSCNKRPKMIDFSSPEIHAPDEPETSDSAVPDANGGDGESIGEAHKEPAEPSDETPVGNPGDTVPTPGIPTQTSNKPSPVEGPKRGIDWPEGRIFPIFLPVKTLDVIERGTIADDMISAVVTLQGLVNREEPRIFILTDSEPSRLWLKEVGGKSTKVAKALDLISKYKNEVKGMVIYDDRIMDTINLATTMSGIENVIAVSPQLASTLKNPPFSLPVFKDLREQNFKTPLEVYQYQFDQYASKGSHRIIFGLNPNVKGHLRDYAVATKGLMIWLNPEGDENALLDRYLALMPHNSPYLGWWKDEPKGVHQAALHGIPVYAADWSSNLTAMGGQREAMTKRVAPAPPPLENKLYVSVIVSDGDNLQEDESLIPLKWADTNRGKVPTAWTINPALVDIAPVIINYLQRTATVNDVLICGPSGLGYTYPNAWPAGSFEKYAKVTGEYMGRAGLNITTLWNDRVDLSNEITQAYLKNVPDLLGMTIQDESRELQIISNKVPIHRLTISYGDTEEILSHGVEAQLKNFRGDKPMFASVQANMNMSTIQPTAITALQKRYEGNPNVVFVRPDHFFKLLAQAQKK